MIKKIQPWFDHLKRHSPLFIILILFIFSFSQLNFTWKRLLSSFDRGQYMLNRMLPPRFDEPLNLLEAAIESLQVAVVGTMLGILLSTVLALLAAKNITLHPLISYSIKMFAAFVRAVPALIWAMLFIIAVGFGPTPGILALGVNSIGMLVKVYTESIEEMDMATIEALRSTGASPLQVIFQGVFPSIMSIFIAWSIFRFDINVRYAAVLGIVGAGGIGWILLGAVQSSRLDAALGATFVIFAMIISIEYITRYMKRQIENI